MPERGNLSCNTQNSRRRLELSYVDFVPSSATYAHEGTKLSFFEDKEAVIKMIIKGRSLNLGHVSRTHRVALDWLFDFINLDPKIQNYSVDSKNQLADILTEGHFTRDEWNHLLYVFTISLFSSINALSSVLQIALMPWRKDNKEVITMKGSSPNRSQLEIWYRGAVRGHQRRHLRLYLQSREIRIK